MKFRSFVLFYVTFQFNFYILVPEFGVGNTRLSFIIFSNFICFEDLHNFWECQGLVFNMFKTCLISWFTIVVNILFKTIDFLWCFINHILTDWSCQGVRNWNVNDKSQCACFHWGHFFKHFMLFLSCSSFCMLCEFLLSFTVDFMLKEAGIAKTATHVKYAGLSDFLFLFFFNEVFFVSSIIIIVSFFFLSLL